MAVHTTTEPRNDSFCNRLSCSNYPELPFCHSSVRAFITTYYSSKIAENASVDASLWGQGLDINGHEPLEHGTGQAIPAGQVMGTLEANRLL